MPAAEEAIKWSRPAFLLDGRPFAMMVAFKAHASFGFWEQGGMRGEAFGRITGFADLPDAASFEALVQHAAARLTSGVRPKRSAAALKPEAEVPAPLAAALAEDAAAKASFDSFSPSARRDYCAWIEEAKRDDTRARRVADAIAWLREGKRRNWKYE